MSYTIQQIEELNFDEFKDKPEELISLAKQLLNIKNFEKAITMLEKAILIAKDKFEKEDALECAKFYFHYADAIIRKLSEGDELFGTNDEGVEIPMTTDKPEDDIKVENVDNQGNLGATTNDGHNNYNNIDEKAQEDVEEEDDEDGQGEEQTEVSDEQYAFENLAFAEKIYKNYLSEYNNTPPEELSDEIKNVYLSYADIFHKYGELEMCKSDFKSAADWFQKALDIRKKYQSKFSRAIAELYWNMATVFDFDSRKCLLCYYKTKVILEYHLKNELATNNHPMADKITINESDLDLEAINPDKVVFFKEVLEACTECINEDIAELVDLLGVIYVKVEDMIIDIKQFAKYAEEAKQEEVKLQFDQEFDKTKAIDVTNLIKKRTRKEMEVDNPDNEEKPVDCKRQKLDS
jgi:hypothetical protein